jgi:hypothetical protein
MSEKRLHPRHDLLAQVQVSAEAEVHVMSTDNISLGGVFIQGVPGEYPEITIGAELDLLIFDANEMGGDVRCRARVVRIEADGDRTGFGLKFVDLTQPNTARLRRLLAASSRRSESRPPSPPPLPRGKGA